MKKTMLLILFVFFINLSAQEDDPNLNKWVPSFVTGLNISQIALENWSKGGDNSLAFALTGDFNLNYKSESWRSKNNLKAAFGKTKLGDQEIRTTENELYLENVIAYRVGWAVNPYFSNTLRTQIATGYDYAITPKEKISDFFDPGYLTQSIGFVYDRLENIQTRLGLAFQETFTKTDTLAKRYVDDPETSKLEKFKLETGLESVTDAKFNLDKNLFYETKLRLFSRFEHIDVWDVRWDNIITSQVNSWLTVNLSVQVVHEISQTKKTQLKEALQIGIVYRLL